MRQRRSLTKRQFDQAVKRTTLSDRAAKMAQAVLVNGDTYAQAGKTFGVTAPAIAHHVRSVWRAHTDASDLPQGFKRITVVLPEDKAAVVLSWERDEKIKLMQL